MHVFGILIYVTFVHCMSFHLSISFSMLYTWHACLLSLVLIGKLRAKQKSHKYKFRLSCWNLVLSLSEISCRHAKMLQLSLTLDFPHITNIYKLQALKCVTNCITIHNIITHLYAALHYNTIPDLMDFSSLMSVMCSGIIKHRISSLSRRAKYSFKKIVVDAILYLSYTLHKFC